MTTKSKSNPKRIENPNPPRKLPNSLPENVDFSLSTVKRVLRHLRTADDPFSPVEIRIKTPRPTIPHQIAETIRIRETNDEGSEIILYNDRWYNAYFAVPLDKLPENVQPYVAAYLDKLRDWKKHKAWGTVSTYPMDYLNYWVTYLTKKAQSRDYRIRDVEANRGITSFLRTNGIDSPAETERFVQMWSRYYKFDKNSRNELRKYRRSLPKAVRFQSIGRGIRMESFHEYLEQVLHLSHYGRFAFHNTFSGYSEVDIAPIPYTGTGGAKIPHRYVRSGLWNECVCCKTYTAPNNSYVSQRDTNKAFLEFAADYPAWYAKKHNAKPNLTKPNNTELFLYPDIKHTNPTTYIINKDLGSLVKIAIDKGYISKHPYKSGEEKKANKDEVVHTPPTCHYVSTNQSIYDYVTSNLEISSPNYRLDKYFIVCQKCYTEMYGARQSLSRAILSGLQSRDYIGNYTSSPLDKYNKLYLANGQSPVLVRRSHTLPDGRKYDVETIDRTLYMGVELEVTPSLQLKNDIRLLLGQAPTTDARYRGDNVDNEAQNISAKMVTHYLEAKRMGILKSDATVHGGFELVTCPGTHEWHMNEAWNGFFREDYEGDEAKLAPASLLLGWANNGHTSGYSICGIHIHVSKAALTQMQLGRMITFAGAPENKHFITKIAGRTQENYARFRSHKIKDGRGLNYQHLAGEIGRDAINLTSNKPTIEFRMFQSNVAKVGFMKNINFVHALTVWAAETSNNALTQKSFIDFVIANKGNYKYLFAWMKRNSVIREDSLKINNKPISETYTKKIIDIDTLAVKEVNIINKAYKPYTEVA